MSGSSDDKETVVDNAAANDDEHSIVDMDDVRQSNIRDLMKLIRAFGGGSTDVSRKTPGRRKRTDTEEGSDSREEAKPRRRSARLVGKVSTAVPEQPERRRRRAGSAKKITVRRLFVFPADKLRSCRAPPSAALLLNLEAKRRLGLYDKETGVTCHQCRQKTTDRKSECANEQCCKTEKGHLCGKCLYDRYGENIEEVWADPEWVGDSATARSVGKSSLVGRRQAPSPLEHACWDTCPWHTTSQIIHRDFGHQELIGRHSCSLAVSRQSARTSTTFLRMQLSSKPLHLWRVHEKAQQHLRWKLRNSSKMSRWSFLMMAIQRTRAIQRKRAFLR
eukprot:tig00020531_g10063.t2